MNPDKPLKIPHVGWNRLYAMQDHPVMEGIKDYIDFYFVHSYECIPASQENILSYSDHGGRFVASVCNGSVIGMQFHPEKSQPAGLTILQNFSDWKGLC